MFRRPEGGQYESLMHRVVHKDTRQVSIYCNEAVKFNICLHFQDVPILKGPFHVLVNSQN